MPLWSKLEERGYHALAREVWSWDHEELLVALDVVQDSDDPALQAWALELLGAVGVVSPRTPKQPHRNIGVSRAGSWFKNRRRSRANSKYSKATSDTGGRSASCSSSASWAKRAASSSYGGFWGYS
jgi:hypothetical protein